MNMHVFYDVIALIVVYGANPTGVCCISSLMWGRRFVFNMGLSRVFGGAGAFIYLGTLPNRP